MQEEASERALLQKQEPCAPFLPFSAPSLQQQGRVWLLIGLQSFGGGVATLTLIRRAVVEEMGWLSDTELTRELALCQMTPGVNLIALAVLIGRKTGGIPGIAVALFGLLMPSIGIAVLITAGYARFRYQAWVQSALQGVLPATVGLGAATAFKMAHSLLSEARRWGRLGLPASLACIALSGVAARAHLPVLAILLTAGALGAAIGLRGKETSQS